jgi:tripartite-type tricarboxylate transporter receptor subunit TctC
MNIARRCFLKLVMSAITVPTASHSARAQSYPTRPVRLVVGFPPGGVGDILARLMGQWFSERLGQPFVVENRPGAAGNVAAEAVVRATPDGYTLLFLGVNHAINATLYENLSFNFIRDIAPVAGLIRTPNAIVVNPLVPAKTLPEFISYAKANPGKISMASAGNGTSAHVAGELFKMSAGIDMVHVPYRGGAPAITGLMGGQVQVLFSVLAETVEHIRAGKLRPLAVTTDRRLEVLPDIPTVGEFLPGYEASGWQGIGAPANTPAEIVEMLNREVNAALSHVKTQERIPSLGSTALPGSRADFGKLIAAETDKWARVVRAAGLKAS